jgi:hypothetical protein
MNTRNIFYPTRLCIQIKVVNGVILISWNQNVLERQIDYGAKLGHVVLSLARMELNNFYKNVTPVSDFYDQRGMLISVSIENKYFYFTFSFRLTRVARCLKKCVSRVIDQWRTEPDRSVQRLSFFGLTNTECPQEPGAHRYTQWQRALKP